MARIQVTENINTTLTPRYWEIDIIRGAAILLMILFHLLYNLAVFYGIQIDYKTGAIYLMGKLAAILFILVAGVCSHFSKNNLRRGIALLCWGFVIFLITPLVLPGANIVFGILHFLGVCMIIYPLFKGINNTILTILGISIILTGLYTPDITTTSDWLAPLGLRSSNFSSADYFPLMPWLGVYLLGILLGRTYLYRKEPLIKIDLSGFPLVLLGRNSLIIYLTHQPLLLLLLHIIMGGGPLSSLI